ncbi:MAG: glycosyltransferase [Bacteroidales bacterium]|nr:glycosyltransferase [Bacteroidales bacterium]MCF8405857.1 glycosyltransferase [Bacteroidales bacterium]
MNRYPLISVLVPAYNHEQYIAATLKSILVDNYPKKELIIINDGSSDRTGQIIDDWISQHQEVFPITYQARENKGVTVTLNDLISKSRGEYIIFIHSDDYLLQDGILNRYNYLNLHPSKSAVFADCIVVNAKGDLISDSGLAGYYRADKKRFTDDRLLIKEIINNWSVPGGTLMVKRDVYEYFKYNPDYLVEDLDFYLRLSGNGKLGYLDEKVSAYRIHGKNTCMLDSNFIKVRKALIDSLSKNARYFSPKYRSLIYLNIFKYKKKIAYYQFKHAVKKILKIE